MAHGAIALKLITVLGGFFKSKHDIEKAALAIESLVLDGQIETNKIQAQHPSVFVAGARPAIMWGLGGAFLFSIFWPIPAAFITAWTGVQMPNLPEEIILTPLMMMLGLRSWDKHNGNDTKWFSKK